MSWSNYKREERPRLSPGDYRMEIVKVVEKVSKAGNPMLEIELRPNGSSIIIRHYIVQNEFYNRNMTELFDSFNIDEGDFDFLTWPGATGAARLKEDDRGYLKVHYFIKRERAENLPEWVGEIPERQKVTDFSTIKEDDDLPWEVSEE